MSIENRITRVQKLLQEQQMDAIIITSPSNFFYFSGIWLDSHERLQAIVISKAGDPLMLVHEMANEEVVSAPIENKVFWKDGEDAIKILAKYLPRFGVISIDNQWPSQNLLALMALKKDLSFVDSTLIVGKMKQIKDQKEIDLLGKSSKIADDVMNDIIDFIKPGLTELEVVEEVKRLFANQGVTKLTFEPVVATGKNSSIPHHKSNDSVIEEGNFVVLDIGGIKDHYCSDMTRTIYIGEEISDEKMQVYEIVKLAQEEAIKVIKPGIPISEVDKRAREVITEHGYGSNFIHRTGHGLGIELHEEPFVSLTNQTLIEEGMVFSVEPGIYLEGEFGVRIEDIVVVNENGCKVLNHVNKNFLNIPIG